MTIQELAPKNADIANRAIQALRSNPNDENAAAIVNKMVSGGITGLPDDVVGLVGGTPSSTPEQPAPITPQAPVETPQPAEKPISLAERVVSTPVAAARGVARAFNPLPVVKGLSSAILTGAEAAGELAARPFIPDDQQPPIDIVGKFKKRQAESPFPATLEQVGGVINAPIEAARQAIKGQPVGLADAVRLSTQRQESATERLGEAAPGVELGSELGAAAASIVELVKTGAKQIPRAGRAIKRVLLTRKAGKEAKKARTLIQKITGGTNESVVETMISNPELVQAKIDGGQTTMIEVADAMNDEIKALEKHLGGKVGEFKLKALKEDTQIYDAEPLREALDQALEQKRLTSFTARREGGKFAKVKGEIALPGKEQREIAEISAKISDRAKLAPSDAMKIVDLIDSKVFGTATKAPTVTGDAAEVLIKLRTALKEVLRPQFPGWDAADANFTAYKNAIGNVAGKLDRDSAASFVDNLFGKNKEAFRNRLSEAFAIADKVDPGFTGSPRAEIFFRNIQATKGAQVIETARVGGNDLAADKINRLYNKWEKRGEQVGTAVGGGLMSLAVPSGNPGANIFEFMVGGSFGRPTGGFIGRTIGKTRANPDRILKAAMKSKRLSKMAKELATDAISMKDLFGGNAAPLFLITIPPTNAAIELSNFMKQSMQEPQGRPAAAQGRQF